MFFLETLTRTVLAQSGRKPTREFAMVFAESSVRYDQICRIAPMLKLHTLHISAICLSNVR